MSSGKVTLDTLIRADPSLTVVGTWLSLVEHSLGVRGVGSSNLPVPTIQRHTRISFNLCILAWRIAALPKFEQFARERQYITNVTLQLASGTSTVSNGSAPTPATR